MIERLYYQLFEGKNLRISLFIGVPVIDSTKWRKTQNMTVETIFQQNFFWNFKSE